LAEQTFGLVDDPLQDPAVKEVLDGMAQLRKRIGGLGFSGPTREARKAELQIRMHSAMKRAIGRLPGYADTIRRYGAQMMNDANFTIGNLERATGLADAEAARESAQKVEEKRQAQIRSIGTSMKMGQSHNENWYTYEARVLEEAQKRGLVDAMKNKEEAIQLAFVNSPTGRTAFYGHPVAVQGDILTTLDAELESGRLQPNQIELRVDELVNQKLSEFDTQFGGVAKHDSAQVVRGRIEGLKPNILRFYKGEVDKEDLERQTAMKKALMEADLLETEEGRWMWFLEELVPELRRDFYLTQGGVDIMSRVARRGREIANGGSPAPDAEASRTLFKITKEGVKNLTSNDPEVIMKNVKVLAGELQSVFNLEDGPDKLKSMTEFASLASNPEFAKLLESDLTGELGIMTEQMLEVFTESMYGSASVGTGERGGAVGRLFDPHAMQMVLAGGNIGIRAKGGVNLSTRHQQDLIRLQKNHIPRINTLVRVRANLSGGDLKQLASDHVSAMNEWGLTPGATPPSFMEVFFDRGSYQSNLERTQATAGSPPGLGAQSLSTAVLGGERRRVRTPSGVEIEIREEGENGRGR
jgi:hypothetical protein